MHTLTLIVLFFYLMIAVSMAIVLFVIEFHNHYLVKKLKYPSFSRTRMTDLLEHYVLK